MVNAGIVVVSLDVSDTISYYYYYHSIHSHWVEPRLFRNWSIEGTIQ